MKIPSIVPRAMALLRSPGAATGNGKVLEAGNAPFDILVTHHEVNRRHGTGVVLRNIFESGRSFAAIRTLDGYRGEQDFGLARFRLPRMGLSRADIAQLAGSWLGPPGRPRRVVCIPFCADEFLTAMAVREIYGIPMAVYIMDDHNAIDPVIPDAVMQEALDAAVLRLAISPEMQRVYEAKFGVKFWVMPPLVEASVIRQHAAPRPQSAEGADGVLIGNIWFQSVLDALRKAVRGAGLRIDWYSNLDDRGPLCFREQDLARDGIRFHPPLPENELAPLLSRYAFAIIPSGAPDGGRAASAVSRLSFPCRLAFLVGGGNIPVIVMGGPDSAAAAFVRRFDLGTAIDYSSEALRDAARDLKTRRVEIARNALCVGAQLSNQGAGEWFWQSMAAGEPADPRFERLFGG